MPALAKVEISPGQSLLLLMSKYPSETQIPLELKRLYLCGIRTPEDEKYFKALLNFPFLSKYQISFSTKVIDSDVSRRYFESHLAYESLKNGLSQIDIKELHAFYETLIQMIPIEFFVHIEDILKGVYTFEDDSLCREYADYIHKLQFAIIFDKLSSLERDKIRLLVQATFIGLMVTNFKSLPLNIYGIGFYSEENRGKTMRKPKGAHQTTVTSHLGLMKSNMPVPENDILRGESVFPLLKPSDQAEYDDIASWVKANFAQLVHPFSNSISGTILGQLRTQAELVNQGQYFFTQTGEAFSKFFQLLISAMLFNSGGHSLNEFTAPFLIPEVLDAFKSIPHYEPCFHLDYMYLTDNQEAFDQALHDTIIYNQIILLRKKVQLEITTSPDSSKILINLKDMLKEFSEIRERVLTEKERFQADYQASYFTFFTNKGAKNTLFQAGLTTLLKNMEQENLQDALATLKKIKEQYEAQFGKKTFLGYADEMLLFLEVLEKKLLSLNKLVVHSPKHK